MSRRNDPRLLFGCVLLLGLVLRLAVVAYFADFAEPTAWEYGDTARSLVSGHGFAGGNWFAPEDGTTPTAWSAPAYVFLLAGALWLFPDRAYLVVEVTQALLSALLPVLIFRLAHLLFGSRVARWALVVAAVYPPLLYYPKQISPAVLSMVITTAAVLTAVEVGRRPTARLAVVCGASMGLAALTEPVSLLTGVGALALMARRLSPRLAALIATMAVLVLMPWEVRNYLTFHAVVPVRTSSGANLWMGNNPFATGSAYTVDGRVMTAVLDAPTIDALSAMDEVQRDATFRQWALDWMVHHPVRVVELSLLRTYYLWWDPPGPSLYPELLTGPSFAYRVQLALHAPVLVLTALGAVVAWHRTRWQVLLLLWVLVSTTLPYAITQASYRRYRLPAEGALIIGTAVSLAWLYASLRARRLAMRSGLRAVVGPARAVESTDVV